MVKSPESSEIYKPPLEKFQEQIEERSQLWISIIDESVLPQNIKDKLNAIIIDRASRNFRSTHHDLSYFAHNLCKKYC